jgi:hypothetical protein
MGSKRTKQDVEDAYIRGFKQGFHAGFEEAENQMHQFQIYLRHLWRKRQLRKLKEAYIRKVLDGGENANGDRTKAN